jgi:hypothetical protein
VNARMTSGLTMLAALALATAAFAGELHFRSGTVQTEILDAGVAAQQLAAYAPRAVDGEPTRVVVQFQRPLTAEERLQLEAGGVRLLRYLGNNGYFASVRPQADAAAIGQVASLSAVLPIDPVLKLHPTLARQEIQPWTIIPDDEQLSGEGEGEPTPVDATNPTVAAYVTFHADVSLAAGEALLRSYSVRVQSRIASINTLVVELPWANLLALADEPAVQYLEPPLPPFSETNDSNRARTGADIAQDPPFSLDGTGVNVMVYDGGSVLTTHPDFGGRATVRDGSGLSDHATHVAGTIGGDGTASGGQNRGMAPNVTIHSYEFEQDGGLSAGFLYTDPGDLELDYNDAINNQSADIANNSIGTNTAPNGFPCEWTGDYGNTSALIDSIVRGSLGQPFRVIWANGNERNVTRCGDLYLTTAPPACAKNHITVGALNSNDDSVTDFTSWGPTDDGRIKPDISAPGCQSDGDDGVTSCSSSGGYTVKCGTSMACPTVTGLSALLLQDYRLTYPGEPLPRNSTLKCFFANTAVDIVNTGPDYQTGYGSVRIVPAIETMRAGQFVEAEISQGDVYRVLVIVPPGEPNMKVTIAWDDAPGTPNVSPSLVNDLDLTVLDPSQTVHFPWTLDPANPANPAVRNAPDHLNNIEQVQIDSPAAGAYIVEVSGFNIPQGPQPFSIVASATLVDCSPAAVLNFDSSRYPCTSIATLQLNDCDLNTDDNVIETYTLTVTSDSEPAGETVLLTETSAESALFVGTLPLDTTDAAGVLLVTELDTIGTTYIDQDNGQGGTFVPVPASATIDCTPAVVSNVTTSEIDPRSAVVNFDTDEMTTAVVRYGLDCALLGGLASRPGLTMNHSVPISGLTDDTTYYFQIEATDIAGNVVVDDNGGACYTFTTPEIPDYFTEQFSSGVDLENSALLFAPNGTIDFYSVCRYDTTTLPTDPAGGTVLPLSAEDSESITLSGGNQILFYGVAYNTVHINSNGNITLDSSDTDSTESIDDHFDNVRIAGLWDDLDPSERGTVSYKQQADRFVVTWENVTEDNSDNSNTFQIELYYDGRIQLAWLTISASDALVGLSLGGGVPIDFLPSDLSGYGACGPRAPSAASRTVAVGEDRSRLVTLLASDDGLPDPPAALAYQILSLPTFQLKDAGNDYVIQPGDLPYTLVAGGDQVEYASSGFVGTDSFQFQVDDGGTPPDGGVSNIATVTVNVVPVLSIPFADSFATTTFSPDRWVSVSGATIDDVGEAEPSAPYSARFNGNPNGRDEIVTHLIDLTTVDAARLSYAWQRTGNGESPDSGDNLYVEFMNNLGSWQLLQEYAGDGADMTTYQIDSFFLPAEAIHDSFRLRFRSTGTSSGTSTLDDWFVDDVLLTVADAPLATSFEVVVPDDGVGRLVQLLAEDPNMDPLDYIILSLPASGATLYDPGADIITAGELPYTLVNGGDQVRILADGTTATGTFQYQATDGTYMSNIADVSFVVELLLQLPVFDDFDTGVLNPDIWGVIEGADASQDGIAEPSGAYAAHFDGAPDAGDTLATYAIDLSGETVVRVEYYWQRTGNGNSPEAGEDLVVEYVNDQLQWQELVTYLGDGPDMTTFEFASFVLPANALHSDFRLRFRNSATSGTNDDWFVDDLHIFTPNAPLAEDVNVQLRKYNTALITLPATDPNGDDLDFVLTSLPTLGTVTDVAAGTLVQAIDLPYTLANGESTIWVAPPFGFVGDLSLEFYATDGTYSSGTATVSLAVGTTSAIHYFPLDSDPGWTTEGLWAFGQPTGTDGDPSAGYNGPNVYGYNLEGKYPNGLDPAEYLTTTAINCAAVDNAQLQFRRWLGVENSLYDHASIDVSNDGTTWTEIWDHDGPNLIETDWSLHTYDISDVADGEQTVYIRWVMGITDGSVNFHGWNIDEVEILGTPIAGLGDIDADGDSDEHDMRVMLACLFGPDNPVSFSDGFLDPAPCLQAFDFNADTDIDVADVAELQTNFTGGL